MRKTKRRRISFVGKRRPNFIQKKPTLFVKSRSRFTRSSEYSKQLKTKQNLKILFYLRERQFKKYYKQSLKTNMSILKLLSMRFDNVIFESGICRTRFESRQLINHRFFKVNDKVCNKPSRILRVNDKVCTSRSQPLRFDNPPVDKTPPSWISVDKDNVMIEIVSNSNRIDDFDLSFYTR